MIRGLQFLAVAAMLAGPAFAAPVMAGGQHTAPSGSDKPILTLNSDAALITMLIKPDKTADFEFVLSKLKDALQRSDKPERKEQAAGWRVFKSPQAVQGNAVYIMQIDRVIRGQEYDITRLIAEVFPVEVQEIFVKYKDAFAGRAIAEMAAVMSMQQ